MGASAGTSARPGRPVMRLAWSAPERPGKHPVHLGQLALGAAEVFDLMPLRPDRHWLSLVHRPLLGSGGSGRMRVQVVNGIHLPSKQTLW